MSKLLTRPNMSRKTRCRRPGLGRQRASGPPCIGEQVSRRGLAAGTSAHPPPLGRPRARGRAGARARGLRPGAATRGPRRPRCSSCRCRTRRCTPSPSSPPRPAPAAAQSVLAHHLCRPCCRPSCLCCATLIAASSSSRSGCKRPEGRPPLACSCQTSQDGQVLRDNRELQPQPAQRRIQTRGHKCYKCYNRCTPRALRTHHTQCAHRTSCMQGT